MKNDKLRPRDFLFDSKQSFLTLNRLPKLCNTPPLDHCTEQRFFSKYFMYGPQNFEHNGSIYVQARKEGYHKNFYLRFYDLWAIWPFQQWRSVTFSTGYSLF